MTKELKQLNLFECTEILLKCTKCGELKPCGEFHKANKKKRGYVTWCKGCCKEYAKDNIEHLKQYHKQYYKNNIEQIKQWREDNTEQIKQYNE